MEDTFRKNEPTNKSFNKSIKLLFVSVAALVITGCGGSKEFIDRVDLNLSPDLKELRAALVFTQKVKLDLAGTFQVGNHGNIFLNPYSQVTAFELGFALDLEVFNEPRFGNLQGTETWPNGVSMGIGYPVIQVNPPFNRSKDFEVFAYVDILETRWLGVASTLYFLGKGTLPSGLIITQNFFQNVNGQIGATAAIFGPVLDEQGNEVRSGGIGLLVNVREIIGKLRGSAESGGSVPTDLVLSSDGKVHFSGPNARQYERSSSKRNDLYRRLNRAISRNSAR